MSLQVWLPLNGNLQNKGLSDISVTNNGATINNSGKIGKCYSFNKNGYLNINKEAMTSFTGNASVCFWVKINSWNTSWDTLFQAGKGSTPWNNYIFGILRNQNNFLCFTITNSENTSSQGTYRTANLTLGEWHHVACVYQIGTCKTYLDGQLCYNYTTNIVPNYTGITSIKIGGLANYYKSDCLLNDFRIYDHALSLKEIKEISKALVLHYPLDDKYIEPTTNLITKEDCLSGTCYNGATNKYGYGANSDIYKEVTTFQGFKGTKVYMGTDGNNAYPYVYISNMFTSDGTNQPAYKTLSFDYYTNIGTSIRPYKLGSGNGTATYRIINSNGISTGTGTNAVTIPVVKNEWNHIEITFHGTTSANAEWGYIQNSPSHISNTNNFWFFANMQLETKDHATGYTLFGTTRNENVIYDTSGYQNNGELYSYNSSGSIEYNINTPKYSGCTFINSDNNTTNTASGTRYIYGHCQLTNPTVLSITFWCKPLGGYGSNGGQGQFCTTKYEYNNANVGSDYLNTAMNHRDSAIDINNSTGDTHCRLSFSPTLNEWHHYAIIYDGQVGKIYKDAVLSSTAQFSTSQNLGSFIGVVIGFSKAGGVWRSNKTYYSDFRMYSSVLNEEDILQLYHTAAIADRNGNLNTYEYNQQYEKKQFLRQNISNFKEYLEISAINPNIMPNSVTMMLGSANAASGTWRLAGTSGMTRSRVLIEDSPIGECYGFQSSGIQSSTINDTSCYGIDSFPFQANTDYVISFYARKTAGVQAYAGFNIYNCTYKEGSYIRLQQQYYITPLLQSGEWVRCWQHIVTNSSTNRNIYIGITTGTQSATAQICAVKIEKGTLPSEWQPKETDENYEQYRIKDNTITINRQNCIFANSFYEI